MNDAACSNGQCIVKIFSTVRLCFLYVVADNNLRNIRTHKKLKSQWDNWNSTRESPDNNISISSQEPPQNVLQIWQTKHLWSSAEDLRVVWMRFCCYCNAPTSREGDCRSSNLNLHISMNVFLFCSPHSPRRTTFLCASATSTTRYYSIGPLASVLLLLWWAVNALSSRSHFHIWHIMCGRRPFIIIVPSQQQHQPGQSHLLRPVIKLLKRDAQSTL